jgi:hypothetical protein
MSEKPTEKPTITLAEKNRIYQQRHRAKMHDALGIETYRGVVNTYMQKYREARNKREGYVKPDPVRCVKQPSIQSLIQPEREIVLKPINDNRKRKKKEENKIEKQKLDLQSSDLSDNSIKDYVSKNSRIYALVNNQLMGSKWEQEIIKALKGQAYDMALEKDALSHFRKDKLQDTIKVFIYTCHSCINQYFSVF